jgi:hypothetical protein
MVQYKAMENGNDGPEFRWQEGDRFSDEIARMDALLEELAKCPPDAHPDGFRLCPNPFFLKFCTRLIFKPDDRGLSSGIYLPGWHHHPAIGSSRTSHSSRLGERAHRDPSL